MYASLDKIAHPELFAEIIYNYKILPTGFVNLAAILMPWVEMISGLVLISGRWSWPSAAILTAMVLVFIAAISFNLARGLDFQCGCFTTDSEARAANITTLLRDVALLVPGIILLVTRWRSSPKTALQKY